jgi:hypothetical protein
MKPRLIGAKLEIRLETLEIKQVSDVSLIE